MLIISSTQNNEPLAARERAAGELVFIEKDDDAAIKRLKEEADKQDETCEKRMDCYLVLKDPTSLWHLQTFGLTKDIERKVDVFATTKEDLLAKTIFVRLPNLQSPFPSLDRAAISRESETTVHLVIVGYSAQAEALAINAALVAHYPNYCRDARLKTRITIIDDNVLDGRDGLIQRYIHLFDNSYYCSINLKDENPQCIMHRPMYENQRKDFVDVEWEFINGNIHNDAVRQKLTEWSNDSHQQLTIAFCHPDYSRNCDEAFRLPQPIYQNEIPVLCHTMDNELPDCNADKGSYSSVLPFGEKQCDIDTLRMLKKLAQRVNFVYNYCFSLKPGEPITLTSDEIDVLTEVEHNRWSVEELILGYRPVTPEEQEIVDKDISQKKILRNTKKAHYDLRSFDDLRADSTGKNVNVYDMALCQAIPLIIKSCI